jgi:hypothetical protein
MCPGVGLREFVFDGVFSPKVRVLAGIVYLGFMVCKFDDVGVDAIGL